ncbi:MAG: hypothetical protein U1B30_14980 [Pseudomonadota bacterium]|nr:hypothetical protein [Pseudomonadota bacterium]
MSVPTTKQLATLVLSFTLWLTATVQAETVGSTHTLSELTSATLELRQSLLAAEEDFFHINPNTLTIYINADNLSDGLLNEITITLDSKSVVEHRFIADEIRALSNGAMKKIYAAPLEPGSYEIKTVVKTSTTNDEQNTTTLTLVKGIGHETLKITVANPLQKRRPELFFEQQRGASR